MHNRVMLFRAYVLHAVPCAPVALVRRALVKLSRFLEAGTLEVTLGISQVPQIHPAGLTRLAQTGLVPEVTGEPRSRTPSRGAWQRYSAPSSPETKSAFDAERYYHRNPLNRRLPDLTSSTRFTCFLLHLLLLFPGQISSSVQLHDLIYPDLF